MGLMKRWLSAWVLQIVIADLRRNGPLRREIEIALQTNASPMSAAWGRKLSRKFELCEPVGSGFVKSADELVAVKELIAQEQGRFALDLAKQISRCGRESLFDLQFALRTLGKGESPRRNSPDACPSPETLP